MIGFDSRGAIMLREKVSRGRITSRLANLPPCLIGIEVGMATQYVARELTALGHDARVKVREAGSANPIEIIVTPEPAATMWALIVQVEEDGSR